MWNKAKVILLANNQEVNSLYGYKDKSLLFNYNKDFYNKLEVEKEFTQHFHLYIINDDVIKVNDWYLATDKIEQCFSKEEANDLTSSCKKIIAATDKSLLLDYVGYEHGTARKYESKVYLPQIPQLFIEQYITEYNQGKIIESILVEYEGIEWLDKPLEYFPKINSDNTINIKPVKDSFSRDEVIALIEKYKLDIDDSEKDMADFIINIHYPDVNTWIAKNL